MHRHEVDRLDSTRTYWVPAVVSPSRNWPGAPGCTRGARFMVHSETLRASRDQFDTFDSELSCLQWIMRNRLQLNQSLPGASIRAVRLDQWLLGLE
jgi:hypothetical protein